MKLPVPMLLLSLLIALSAAAPAQARGESRKASAVKVSKSAVAAKSRLRQRPVAVRASQTRRVAAQATVPLRPSQMRREAAQETMPSRTSFGQMQGLHADGDSLDLKSSVALVVDQDTNEVLFSKNPGAVLPIASITKLMTGLVVSEAKLPMDELLTVSQDDIDTEKGSHSRLAVGTQLTRGEMMHLALMSSENRAANALGRHFPGGLDAFVAAMNRKAAALGMRDTHYVEPTGLSSKNQSSAQDLAVLVREAHRVPLLRELSTSQEAQVAVGRRVMQFRNTNGLVRNPMWEIGLQKTGYIVEAGRCVVMQAQLAGRKLIMVLLDSTGKYSRIGDAERIRKWLGTAAAQAAPPAVKPLS